MKNRIISFILALSLIAVIMPALSTPSYAAGVYDAGKAVEYSYNNYDKNLGQLCAEFVSNCIKAGGITDVFSKGTGPLINQLLDGGYGTLYKMEISGGELKSNGSNTGKVKPGDVICWYCTNCRKYPHVAIVSKIEKDIVYYNAHNTSVRDGHWIGTYTSASHSGHKFDVYILSMQTCSHPSYSFKNSSFYCDKCGSEYPIKETTCNEWMDIAKVNGSGTAPAHIKPYGDATISARYSKNDYVNVVASATNKYGNLWYKLVDGSWLEAGYLTKHTHCYNSDVRCTHCTEGMEIIPLNNVSLTATQSPYTTHLAPYGDAVGVSQTASALTVNAKAVNAYGNIWYRLTNGRWIWSKYVQSPAVDGVVKSSASGGLSLNSKAFAAGTNGSKKLTVIPAGAHITVYPSEKCGNWYSVSYNGVVGYAAGNYISLFDDSYKSISDPEMQKPEPETDNPILPAPTPSSPGTGTDSISVTLDYPTDSTYLSKFKITDTGAVLVSNIKKTSGSSCTRCGVTLMDSGKNVLASYTENVTNVGTSMTSFHAWYDVNKELGVTLVPGTTYYYQFSAVVNGKTYYGKVLSFTTSGTKSNNIIIESDVEGENITSVPAGANKQFEVSCMTVNPSNDAVLISAHVSYTGEKPYKLAMFASYSPYTENGILSVSQMVGIIDYESDEATERLFTVGFRGINSSATCYYQYVWYYEDGTTGVSDVYSFTTLSEGAKDLEISNIDVRADADSVTITCDAVSGPYTPYDFAMLFSPDNTMEDGHLASYYNPGTEAYSAGAYALASYEMGIAGLSENTVYYFQFVWDYDDGTFGASEVFSFRTPSLMIFSDVAEGDWFYSPVYWAVGRGITNGTSETTFTPARTCTQAEILTFMYRAAGKPTVNISNPFIYNTDSGSYYYNALLWAWQNGLVTDVSFNPMEVCCRKDVVKYLWILAGRPVNGACSFTDVSDGTLKMAVKWAEDEGITTGTSATTFSPDKSCTRGEIVTFLYRAYN